MKGSSLCRTRKRATALPTALPKELPCHGTEMSGNGTVPPPEPVAGRQAEDNAQVRACFACSIAIVKVERC